MNDTIRKLGNSDGEYANILFLASPFSPGSSDRCTELLQLPNNRESAIIFVLTSESPDGRLRSWRSRVDAEGPEKIGFVNLRGVTRGGAEFDSIVGDSEVRIENVNSPGNLTKIGIALVKLLEWTEDDRTIAACFDTMTTLLQYVDSQAAYRFLNAIMDRTRAFDVTAHYHLDPTAHDEADVNLLLALFDAVVEHDEDEGWRVRTR